MTRSLFLTLVLFFAFEALAVGDVDEAISKLSDADRKIVIDIKQEVASWSQTVLNEVKSYQDMVIMLRGQVQQKYNALSADAKSAITKEEQLTVKLSPNGLKALSALTEDNVPDTTPTTK